jgi:4,5-DOPA dioxygenase extradiol
MIALPAAVFVSHGSPMLALDGGRTADAWRALAADMPKPRAVLIVSAHWETAAPAVSAAASPSTIHDFGGFPQPLYEIQYSAPGAPWLAERARDLLAAANLPAAINATRGIDHGAWVPLREMYPEADVPVVQLALQTHLGAPHHYRLGQALAGLQNEGVLILGSGNLTHNLSDMIPGVTENSSRVPAYVPAFADWMHDKVMAHDVDALVDYRRRAPAAARAHPSEEHLFPLHVVLGAAGSTSVPRRTYWGITEGALAMDVYTFAAA